jgi:Lantibiotic dehydratase, N terminus
MQSVEVGSVSSALPDHLISLPHSHWAVWRWVGLRGAGFPVRDLLKIRASQLLLDSVDEVLDAERSVEMARKAAIEEVNSSLDSLRREDQWDDKLRRMPLLKMRSKLVAGGISKSLEGLDGSTAIGCLLDSLRRRDAASACLKENYLASSNQTSDVISELANCPRFREAVTWQNRNAVHTALDWVLRQSPRDQARGSRRRQNEELVASYLQRYCAKNDTIGFFGPVGWARLRSGGRSLSTTPGPGLLATRKVYFETWSIAALAKVIMQDSSIYPSIAPVTMPFVRVEGQKLHHPIYGIMAISSGHAALIQRCNGFLTARQIAEAIIRPPALFKSEIDVYESLADLAAKRVVFWDINIPRSAHPERTLRDALLRIENPCARERALNMLSELECACDRVQEACGDAERLDKEIENLQSVFTNLTNVAATRSHGLTYGGRTLIYEDCRRDIEVSIGPEMLDALGPPLSLLLTSARWLTAELARRLKQIFLEIYAELTRSTGRKDIDAVQFWTDAMPYLVEEKSPLVQAIEQEFQRKWEIILDIPEQRNKVEYSSEELRERVAAEFASDTPGWVEARYHCPDVMIAASSIDAVNNGDYVLVLGEMHLGGNTLGASLFVNQHHAPEELFSAVAKDLGIKVNLVIPDPNLLGRTVQVLHSPSDVYLEYTFDAFAGDRSRAFPISSFVIEKDSNGEIMARMRDRPVQFSAIDLVGGRLSDLVVDSFHLLGTRAHTPRISIDRLVVKRESWRFSPTQIAFAQEQDAADRFLRARQWQRDQSLPRFIFFKVPVETKPVYLDFESPLSVDLFSRLVRKTMKLDTTAAWVEISEMLPTPNQAWLLDIDNNRYTSELRMVAVDIKHLVQAADVVG